MNQTTTSPARVSRHALMLFIGVTAMLGLALAFRGPDATWVSHAFALSCGGLLAMLVSRSRAPRAQRTEEASTATSTEALPLDAITLNEARLAAEAVGVRVFDWDINANRLYLAGSRMSSCADAAASNETPEQFIASVVHPDDLPRYRETITAALKSDTTIAFAYRARQEDGVTRPQRLYGRIARDASGRPMRVRGVIVDMSAHEEAAKRIEQQSREQQRALERLELAKHVAGIGIWDMDLVAGQLAGDTNMAQLWQQPDKEAFPNLLDFLRKAVHPDDLPGLERALGKSMKYGVPVDHRYREIRPDGSMHFIQLHGKTFCDAAGTPERVLAVTVNVDAQTLAAQALEEQARQQAALLERLNLAARVGGIGVWDWDLVTDRMNVDAGIARACAMPSLTIEGGVREACESYVHPDDLPGYRDAIAAGLAHGESFSHRYRVFVGNGDLRPVQYHARVFRDEAGRPVRMLGVTIDVSAEVQRAEQLRIQAEQEHALRDRLNLATETAGIGVWDMDLATRDIVADANIFKILGREETLTMESLSDLIHPDDRALVWAKISAPVADEPSREALAVRHRIVRPNGEVRHVQTHVRVFREDSKPKRILGVTWDVTSEVEYTQELRRQAEDVKTMNDRLSVACRAAGISAWELDLGLQQVVWANARTKAFGLDDVPLEEYGPGIRRLMLPEDSVEYERTALEAIEGGKSMFDVRYRIRKSDGSIRHIQSYAHIVRDDSGRAVRLLGATLDITNEVQTTALLQRQAEQERELSDRLAIATEAANIGRWEIDLVESKVLWAENLIEDLRDTMAAGTSLQEYGEFIHPDDRSLLSTALREAIKTNSDRISYRYRAYTKDRRIVHVQLYGRLLRDELGRVSRVLGCSWDITKEILAAQKLEDQIRHGRMLLDRLSMATDAAGICSWEIDMDEQRFLWTENWLEALGDTRPEDGLDIETFLQTRMHPEDRNVFVDAIRDTLRQRADRFSCKYRAIGSAGNVVYVQSDGRLMMDEHGRARRLLAISQDITHAVLASREIEAQAEQRRHLLERLKLASEAAGICSFEVDVERGVFLWSENPIRALTSREDLCGMTIDEFSKLVMIPEDRSLLREATRNALRAGETSFRFRYRGRGEDQTGPIVHVETHAHFIRDASGRAVRLLGVSWDVTSTVEAAQKLEEQSVQQRLLLERLSIATQVADISSWELDFRTGQFLWIENPIAALFDPTDESRSVAKFVQRVLPEDQMLMRNEIAKAMAAGTDRFSYRYRAFGLDRSIVHVQNYVKLTFDANGSPISALGASWNVSKEVEAAQQLEQQAEQLRLVESRVERASLLSFEGHWESDLVAKTAWYSSSYYKLLGYQDGELPSGIDEVIRLIHPDDVGASTTALQQHIETGSAFSTDLRMRCGNGEYRWFRQRGSVTRDADGNALVLSGSIQDIDEQKLAEDALQLAQRRFERAINGTQDGLWELETDGNAWCSPRVGELLGHSPAEFLPNTNFLREYLHPDDAQIVASATQGHFQQDTAYDIEIRLRTKSGDYRWFRARAKAERNSLGRPLRLSGSLQDVTEARAAREALVQATEAAESANRAKSFFLANVSHEIRTPMNGIIGMTGLLLDTALDRTQRDYAETIRGSADSLLIVINDILDFSKIEAGKLDIEAIELDLRGNVEDVGSMMAFQAAAKNLELVVHVHPDVPNRVISDPQRIRQCLINLVGNAIKFTRQGEIVIEVSTIGERDGKTLIQFQVRDTGIGIAPETLRTLFQPFVQADASTTRHFGGTGLGLSIVRRLVEMMDGAVGIESEVGKGSTFWFTLPLERAISTAPSVGPDLHRLGRRVLIVDDHETNRRVLAGQLMHEGFEVSLAQNGTEALQLLRQGRADNHPYDVVLADYQMNDMDGAALGERINSDPHLSRARVVILTSLDRHGDIRRFASLGFAGYLTKPVKARELFDCLDRVLSRDAKEWHLQSQPIVTRGILVGDDSPRRYEDSVLLVEDNPVNQKVAVRFLERMGCSVRVADNGAEGVKAYQEARFDIVLMDLQMPVMDGLTAARRIREIEAGGPATPIVALTANAMSGQLERCMDAGMNGFLTKPLEINRLYETLELYGLATRAIDTPHSGSNSMATPVNLARLNEITDGDPEFAYELAATFISSGEQVLLEIQQALEAFDRNALSRAAHKLKGASANIHAEALRELAYALESQAASVDQPRLKELVKDLRHGFFMAADFLREQAPPPQAQAS